MFLGKDFLKIWNQFTGERPWLSVISIKLQSNFFEITLRHGCSHVDLLRIFRPPLYKYTCGGLLLIILFIVLSFWTSMSLLIKETNKHQVHFPSCSMLFLYIPLDRNNKREIKKLVRPSGCTCFSISCLLLTWDTIEDTPLCYKNLSIGLGSKSIDWSLCAEHLTKNTEGEKWRVLFSEFIGSQK